MGDMFGIMIRYDQEETTSALRFKHALAVSITVLPRGAVKATMRGMLAR